MKRAEAPDPLRLVAWYDDNARALPWRVGPADRKAGVPPDPYRVWLSEVMLQQTTVAAVGRYYADFTRRWPDVDALAAAPVDEVMAAWAGLGYYARARHMKACAEIVARDHGGRFPTTAAELAELPGIGPYTAAAIAAIAFDEPVPVVDGNVERVLARVFGVETPLPKAKAEIRDLQATLTPRDRPGDYAQAVMDLGATICTPRRPACGRCPWRASCAARRAGDPERLPVKAPKRKRPTRYGAAFVISRDDGAVLLRRRPAHGLLGGMVEVPGTTWGDTPLNGAPGGRPRARDWTRLKPPVRHVFTHFELELAVWTARMPNGASPPDGCWWQPREGLADAGLPSVMKKALEAGLPGATRTT